MKISVVSTLYHSKPYLEEFCERVVRAISKITDHHELILVNDGSPDDSLAAAIELQKLYPTIIIADLARNFGHHRAIMTGLQMTTGDYVFLIDSDLEESPELINEYWSVLLSDEKLDVVFGVQTFRKGGWFERQSGKLFYKFFAMITSLDYPADSITARLMTKRYVNSVISFREKELDIWGVFVLAGHNQKAIPVTKLSKGNSTYSFHKKVRVAIEMITTLSHRPLYITFFIGLLFLFVSFVSICVIVYEKVVFHTVEGWASILAAIWFVGGVILFVLGIFGVYLSKMYLEIKNRPLTIVKNIYRHADKE